MRNKPSVFGVLLGKSNNRRTCVVVAARGRAVPGHTPGGGPRVRGQKSAVIILKKAVPHTGFEGVPQRPDIESNDFTFVPSYEGTF